MSAKTFGPNDDRRTTLYRGGRKIATAGDLNEPIAFVRSTRLPNDVDAFIQTITPFFRAWANIAFGERRPSGDNENVDTTYTHVFTVRNCEELTALSERDYVVWKDQLFAVRSTKPLAKTRDFLQIRGIEWTRLIAGQPNPAIVENETAITIPTSTPGDTKFWGDVM